MPAVVAFGGGHGLSASRTICAAERARSRSSSNDISGRKAMAAPLAAASPIARSIVARLAAGSMPLVIWISAASGAGWLSIASG